MFKKTSKTNGNDSRAVYALRADENAPTRSNETVYLRDKDFNPCGTGKLSDHTAILYSVVDVQAIRDGKVPVKTWQDGISNGRGCSSFVEYTTGPADDRYMRNARRGKWVSYS